MVRMVLMQTHDPEEFVHMVLMFMSDHSGSNALKGAIGVLNTVVDVLEEMNSEKTDAIFVMMTEAALHPEMPYDARGHLFSFMIYKAYESDEYQDLATMRHFVENSFETADQDTLLAMLDNITMTMMLGRYKENEAQRHVAHFLIMNLEEEPRSVEMVRMQIDLLLHLSMGFYLDMNEEIYEPTYDQIANEVLPTLTNEERTELMQLMVRQTLEAKVGELAHASFLEYFLSSQQSADTMDANMTREVMRFIAFNQFDTMHPGISQNEVVHHLINRAIDIDIEMGLYDGDSFFSGLVYLSLKPDLMEINFNDVMNMVISYVVNNTDEADVLQMVAYHILGSRAHDDDTRDLVMLLANHIGEVEHSPEERDVIIRALAVQALREHFGAPGAQIEVRFAVLKFSPYLQRVGQFIYEIIS